MSAYFPIFINLENKCVLVYGAGKIAARRVGTLLSFGPAITVIAPEAVPEMENWHREGKIRCEKRSFLGEDELKGADLVLAATSDPAVNDRIWAACRALQIPVNVASDREKCDFYFPGIIKKEHLVVGVTASGKSHSQARQLTEKLREEVEKYGNEYETAKTS